MSDASMSYYHIKEVIEMTRLFGFALVVLALALSGASTYAATMNQPTKQVATASTEMKGEITRIKAEVLTLKDEAGKSHLVRAAGPKLLEGIKVGDKVVVQIENGKATSIQKVEAEPAGHMSEDAPAAK